MGAVSLRMLGGLLVGALMTFSTEASALLFEATIEEDPTQFAITYFYPYASTYTQVDEPYAFDDDPLEAFIHEPFIMKIEVNRMSVRRSMVRPRASFVELMYESTDAI